jgi:hypothetical protein
MTITSDDVKPRRDETQRRAQLPSRARSCSAWAGDHFCTYSEATPSWGEDTKVVKLSGSIELTRNDRPADGAPAADSVLQNGRTSVSQRGRCRKAEAEPAARASQGRQQMYKINAFTGTADSFCRAGQFYHFRVLTPTRSARATSCHPPGPIRTGTYSAHSFEAVSSVV